MADEKNRLIIPKRESRARVCPACGCDRYSGRNVGGTVTFTCQNDLCRNKWQGGLGTATPEDPLVPPPVVLDKQSIEFVQNPKRTEGYEEIMHPSPKTPDFRRGAPITEGEDE